MSVLLKQELLDIRQQNQQMRTKISHANEKLAENRQTIGLLRIKESQPIIHRTEPAQESQPKKRNAFQLNLNVKAAVNYLWRKDMTEEGADLRKRIVAGIANLVEEQFKHQKSVHSIFNMLKHQPQEDHIFAKDFISRMQKNGILKDDPRLALVLKAFEKMPAEIDFMQLSSALQGEGVRPNPWLPLYKRAMSGNLLIQDFKTFSREMMGIFKECRQDESGDNASYIPELAMVDSKHWGVAMCTIDGQRFKTGDCHVPFSIQSTSKPFSYAFAREQRIETDPDFVHNHVGAEPSGQRFNALIVNEDGLPHNPVINAGAIMVASLLWPDQKLSARFAMV